jgi:hypothetical protein
LVELVTVAATPLNFTVPLAPKLVPKFVPVIVTDVPAAPPIGVKPVMVGGGGGGMVGE